jgi:hypothetical protein
MTLIETISEPAPPAPVTVSSALEESSPVYPAMLAVMVAVPEDFASTTPGDSTVATPGLLETQLDSDVSSWVVAG